MAVLSLGLFPLIIFCHDNESHIPDFSHLIIFFYYMLDILNTVFQSWDIIVYFLMSFVYFCPYSFINLLAD